MLLSFAAAADLRNVVFILEGQGASRDGAPVVSNCYRAHIVAIAAGMSAAHLSDA